MAKSLPFEGVADSGSPGLTVMESFEVAVADVNEAPTNIALDNNFVNENAAGVEIGSLAVVDPDDGDTHTLVVSDARFEIVDGKLKLKSGVGLNFEAGPQVAVDVTATDSGMPQASFTQSLVVIVTDVNEPPLTGLFVNENSSGAVVAELRADDPDAEGEASFTVSDDRFEVIDSRLKLKDGISLNHESDSAFTITLTATDARDPTQILSQEVTINVVDINETPAQVTISNLDIRENLAGIVVGIVFVNDEDINDTHQLSVDDDRFELVDEVLKLKNGVFVNQDEELVVQITVTATDSGSLQKTETQTQRVLANPFPWQNPDNQFDTDDDGFIAPLDVLVIINLLNDSFNSLLTQNRLPRSRPASSKLPFYDVNGDGFVAPVDVLNVINQVNNPIVANAEASFSLDRENHLTQEQLLSNGSTENHSSIIGRTSPNTARQTRLSESESMDAVYAALGGDHMLNTRPLAFEPEDVFDELLDLGIARRSLPTPTS